MALWQERSRIDLGRFAGAPVQWVLEIHFGATADHASATVRDVSREVSTYNTYASMGFSTWGGGVTGRGGGLPTLLPEVRVGEKGIVGRVALRKMQCGKQVEVEVWLASLGGDSDDGKAEEKPDRWIAFSCEERRAEEKRKECGWEV